MTSLPLQKQQALRGRMKTRGQACLYTTGAGYQSHVSFWNKPWTHRLRLMESHNYVCWSVALLLLSSDYKGRATGHDVPIASQAVWVPTPPQLGPFPHDIYVTLPQPSAAF